MDFQERKVSFREADHEYAELKLRLDAGEISSEEFDAQRKQLMVQDAEGRWWAKSRGTGEWRYKDDSGAWLPVTPLDYALDDPGYQQVQAGRDLNVDPTERLGGRGEHLPAARSRMRTVLIAGSASLFALLVLVVTTASLTSVGAALESVVGGGVLAPDLTGQTKNAAERSVDDDFEIEVGRIMASSEPKDTIIGQDPEPGEPVQPGSTIHVIMSAGQEEETNAEEQKEDAAEEESPDNESDSEAEESAPAEWSAQEGNEPEAETYPAEKIDAVATPTPTAGTAIAGKGEGSEVPADGPDDADEKADEKEKAGTEKAEPKTEPKAAEPKAAEPKAAEPKAGIEKVGIEEKAGVKGE